MKALIQRVSSGSVNVGEKTIAAIGKGLVQACHDLSEGGLAVAASEMCIGGGLGLKLDISGFIPHGEKPTRGLFGETTGCMLVEVDPNKQAEFEGIIRDTMIIEGSETSSPSEAVHQIGEVIAEFRLLIQQNRDSLIDVDGSDLEKAWNVPEWTRS